jgi:hypothetical protein
MAGKIDKVPPTVDLGLGGQHVQTLDTCRPDFLIWTGVYLDLDRIWTKYGPNLDQIWNRAKTVWATFGNHPVFNHITSFSLPLFLPFVFI